MSAMDRVILTEFANGSHIENRKTHSVSKTVLLISMKFEITMHTGLLKTLWA